MRNGENGMLVDFFDHEAIAEQVLAVFGEPGSFAPLRALARQEMHERFSRQSGLTGYWKLLGMKTDRIPKQQNPNLASWGNKTSEPNLTIMQMKADRRGRGGAVLD